MEMIYTAYLLIGGNLGDRMANLQSACERIEAATGDIISASGVYETAAWGNTEQPSFLNQVLVLQTTMAPEQLMSALLDIEASMGRVRMEKMGPRIIDIDILLVDDMVLDTTLVQLPHPALHLRRFALTPLSEVAPGKRHPLLQKTVSELLTVCPDALAVQKIS